MVLLIQGFYSEAVQQQQSFYAEQRLPIYPHFRIIKFSLHSTNDAVTSQRKHGI